MKDTAKLLRDGLIKLGFVPSEEQINAFLFYLTKLKKWNKAYNLTGLNKDEDIVIKHFLDSILYLKVIPEGKKRVADVGSGAGFPGIPIKIICPEIYMYLIEPSGKKSLFLEHIIKKLNLEKIKVIKKKIEDIKIGHEIIQPIDIAVTRALFDIKEFIKKASHLFRGNGILILNKGPRFKEELKMLKDVKYEILNINLPLSNIKRYIITVNL